MFKKFSIIFLLLICIVFTISCRQKRTFTNQPFPFATQPELNYIKEDYDLDFNDMNAYVIDYLRSDVLPFFFVKDNKNGLLKGDNLSKTITFFCTCMNGTTVNDLDLFLSMALIGMSYNAAEQDFRFKAPNSNNSHYTDFGNLFNVYDLKIEAVDESGNIIRNELIKATDRMPEGIKPEYINID